MRAEVVINTLFKNSIDGCINLITIIFCLIVMVQSNFTLMLYAFLATSVFIVFISRIIKWRLVYERSSIHVKGQLQAITFSILRNLELIKASSLSDYVLNKRQQVFDKNFMQNDQVNCLDIASQLLPSLFHHLITLIILCMGCQFISLGKMTVGQLIQFMAIYLIFDAAISKIVMSIKSFQDANIIYTRLADILSYKRDVRFEQGNRQPGDEDVVFDCHDVTFFYNQHSNPVINKINLKVMLNQHVALVGKTGSGKSTLARLLCGLYSPHSGFIQLFGNSVQSYSAVNMADFMGLLLLTAKFPLTLGMLFTIRTNQASKLPCHWTLLLIPYLKAFYQQDNI